MAKQLFNEAEQYLVKNWLSARQLEKAVEKVRNKYGELYDRVVEAVHARHAELDIHGIYVKQYWGEGHFWVTNKKWKLPHEWPVGLYVGHLRLEFLSGEDEASPHSYIWTKPAIKTGVDLKGCQRRFDDFASTVLTTAEHELRQEEDDEEPVVFRVPYSGQELVAMLLEGDGQKFVDCMVAQIDLLAKFTPVLNEILEKPQKPNRA